MANGPTFRDPRHDSAAAMRAPTDPQSSPDDLSTPREQEHT